MLMRPNKLFCLFVVSSLLGCGARSSLSGSEYDSAGGEEPEVPEVPDVVTPPGCDNTNEPIYLLGHPTSPEAFASLHVLDPVAKQVTLAGTLTCPVPSSAGFAAPNGMTMRRDGTLWISALDVASENVDGLLYRVNPADLSCELVDVKIADDWSQLVLGFVYEGEKETLYAAGVDGGITGEPRGLGWIDFDSKALIQIGPLGAPLTGDHCELTGIGNERLFAFCRTSPMRLAELLPATAEVLSVTELPELGPSPGAWAMTFWGGDFYLFTANIDAVRASRFRPSDGSLELDSIPNMEFSAIGAATHPCPKGS
jgi:hypothetical protein